MAGAAKAPNVNAGVNRWGGRLPAGVYCLRHRMVQNDRIGEDESTQPVVLLQKYAW